MSIRNGINGGLFGMNRISAEEAEQCRSEYLEKANRSTGTEYWAPPTLLLEKYDAAIVGVTRSFYQRKMVVYDESKLEELLWPEAVAEAKHDLAEESEDPSTWTEEELHDYAADIFQCMWDVLCRVTADNVLIAERVD